LLLDNRKQKVFKGIKASELVRKKFKEVDWIVPGVIPEGLTILAGAPKSGKSWLALHIALSLSIGEGALGKIQVPKREVLYLALEDGERRLGRRIITLDKGRYDLEQVTFFTEWDKGEGGFQDLLGYKAQYPETGLIIIDTLQLIRGKRIMNDTYRSDYEELARLKKIAEKVPIVLIHHTRKAASNDPLNEVSGTLGITGAADTVLRLHCPRLSTQAELFVSSREFEEKSLELDFSVDTAWTVKGSVDEMNLTNERRQILDYLKLAGEPQKPAEIAANLGKNPSTVRSLVLKLLKEGFVVSPKYGYYQYVSCLYK
jgi:RecA-family ATPase